MDMDWGKQDRVVRLMALLRLAAANNRQGLTTKELSDRLEVSRRTVQRDIRALQDPPLSVPFYEDEGRWKVAGEYFLPSLQLSLPEAMGLLLSARLSLRHADRSDQFTAAAYEKVASVLPDPIRREVAFTADALAGKRSDPAYSSVLGALFRAWAERRKVRVTYTVRGTYERVLWPLFLEPSPLGHAIYLLAWDEKVGEPRSYKVERISSVAVQEERFTPPAGFDVGRHLAAAWGIWGGENPVEVVLVFSESVAKRVAETEWHPSQELSHLPDGRVRLRLQIGSWLEIRHWVLGWGETCEVVAPAELRESVKEAVSALTRLYGVA